MPKPRLVGTFAEDQAADYLISQGYVIVTRRYRTRLAEIDIVALDGEELVFVEVKYRARGAGEARLAIDEGKLKQLILAAEQYVADAGYIDRPSRFDLISISPSSIVHDKNLQF